MSLRHKKHSFLMNKLAMSHLISHFKSVESYLVSCLFPVLLPRPSIYLLLFLIFNADLAWLFVIAFLNLRIVDNTLHYLDTDTEPLLQIL